MRNFGNPGSSRSGLAGGNCNIPTGSAGASTQYKARAQNFPPAGLVSSGRPANSRDFGPEPFFPKLAGRIPHGLVERSRAPAARTEPASFNPFELGGYLLFGAVTGAALFIVFLINMIVSLNLPA